MRIIIILISMVLASSLFIGGCSQNVPPSKAHIKRALVHFIDFEDEVPPSWTGNLEGLNNPRLISFKVIKQGPFNAEQGFWPFRIQVKIEYQLGDAIHGGKKMAFENTGNFILYQDNYSDWKASLK